MKLDARANMIMVICMSTLALVYNTPGQLMLLLGVALMLLLMFHLDLGRVAGYLKSFLGLMVALLIIQCLFTRVGQALLSVGQVPLITTQGLVTGGSVVLRMAVIIAMGLLLSTSGSRDFILGLVQWKVPYEIAFMVLVAFRFLPIFRDEMVNVVTAVQLRGVEIKQVPWGQKIVLYRHMFFPIAYRAMIRAQQLSVAMEARGFRAYPQRTYLRHLHFKGVDYAVMLICPVATIALLAWQFI